MKKTYAVCVEKFVKIQKGRNKGKFKTEMYHLTFTGTWEELEDWLHNNGYTLLGYDY